jgi:hypothetical protein
MDFLVRLLTWWNSQTLGTQIFTSRHGIKVGEDDQGNIFYRDAADKRRWVIFNGESEATRVGLAGLDDEVVGGLFQKYGERQRGKNQSDHDDHEDGRALRARRNFRFPIPDYRWRTHASFRRFG